APRAAGARGGLGHDAAARPGRSGGGHRGRHEPGAPARRPPARRGMGARRVPVAPGGAAPLPRAERQPAAAARALGAPGPGRGSAGRGVPRPARARAPGAEGAGVGADRAGAAPGHRARGAGRRAPGPGRARSRRERRRDPRQAPLDRGPGGGAVKAAAAGWLFVAPALAVIGLFFALPVGAALLLSLTDFDLYALADPRHLRVVGLGNYADLLRAPLFWKAMWNTTYFVLVGVPLSIGLSLGAALLLDAPAARFKPLFRTALFAPVVTTLVAVAVIWRYLFHTGYGLVNWALGHLGVAPVDWLGDPRWAMPTIILFAVWKNFGYNMVILLAGLQAIPRDLYEAARIDGASRRRQFLHITLPGLGPVLLVVGVITVSGYFQLFA